MIDYRRFTLDNGLRVILNFDPAKTMAAVNVLYNTGARDEDREHTGIAHLFEHLMFGGSAHVEDFDLELSDAGGNSNAWTSNDFTNFYDVLPAVNIETALHLESDRMLALSWHEKPLVTQRSVVLEEFKQQCLNTPYGDMMHMLRPAVYGGEHPYSWPVIGIVPEHIAAVTADDVKSWLYTHYAPNNAVLAISGNVPYDRGRELVEKWMGDIPRRDIGRRQLPAPAFPAADVVLDVEGKAPVPLVMVAIPMAAYGSKAYRAADCITDILAAGASSRLYRRLVMGGDGTIVSADASVTGSEHEGMLMLTARVATDDRNVMRNAAERMLAELRALGSDEPVAPHELERTLNRFESTFRLSNLDVVSRATNLALAEIHGEDINDTVALQRALTVDDITDEAARLGATPHVTMYYTSRP